MGRGRKLGVSGRGRKWGGGVGGGRRGGGGGVREWRLVG